MEECWGERSGSPRGGVLFSIFSRRWVLCFGSIFDGMELHVSWYCTCRDRLRRAVEEMLGEMFGRVSGFFAILEGMFQILDWTQGIPGFWDFPVTCITLS